VTIEPKRLMIPTTPERTRSMRESFRPFYVAIGDRADDLEGVIGGQVDLHDGRSLRNTHMLPGMVEGAGSEPRILPRESASALTNIIPTPGPRLDHHGANGCRDPDLGEPDGHRESPLGSPRVHGD
jgi:hypothetical protein